MAIFLVLADDAGRGLGGVIARKFPNDHKAISQGQWAVAADMTAQSLCEHLGASDGEFGRILVSPITSYYGWHSNDLWDWLKLKKAGS